MKKLIAVVAACSLLAACGRPIDYNGKHYPTHGVFNEDTAKSKDMCYEVSVGNVVWSVILIETIVFPIYFIGWSLWNPVGPKGANGECGIDAQPAN